MADAAAALGVALERPPVEPATDEMLERIHPDWFVQALESGSRRGGGWIDADTFIGPESMLAARLAAGATIAAARRWRAGEASIAFAVVRPPGHHAAEERAAGFCLLNNIAVAVAGLRRRGLAQRIAIVDWDVHHGDGTQAIFDADPDLCYASTHEWPFYPGTGAEGSRGVARPSARSTTCRFRRGAATSSSRRHGGFSCFRSWRRLRRRRSWCPPAMTRTETTRWPFSR